MPTPIHPSDLEREAVHRAITERAARSGITRVHLLAFRDRDDPEAGGSEVHAAQVASHLAAAGLEVEHHTGRVRGRPDEVERDGVFVHRHGGRLGVFPRTMLALRRSHLGAGDGIVEIFHGIPFFAPLWARCTPQVAVVHHVNLGNWHNLLPPPGAAVGHLLERLAVPVVYRGRPIVAISASTRAEVLDAYRSAPERVPVAWCGVDPAFTPGGERAPDPLVVAVARMMPAKAIPDLVAAFATVRRCVPTARLVLVGDGPTRPAVQAAVRAHGLDAAVELTGHVTDEELVRWYQGAWVVASASRREGFGLTFTEAGACGTPAVATRIPGHVDAIVDGTTGFLGDDAPAIADALVRVLEDPELRARLGAGALAHAATFRWELGAQVVLETLCDDADRRG